MKSLMRLGVFLFCVLCFSLRAGDVPLQGCEDWIRQLARVEESKSGLLYLDPGQERFLIASLVRVPARGGKNSKRLLAVAGYADRHAGINSALGYLVDTGEIESYRYEWLGETRWLNVHDYATQGALVEANETAGFFPLKVEPEDLGRNRIGKLIGSLRAHDRAMLDQNPKRIRSLSPTRLRIPFERSVVTRRFHLMPWLDEFIAVLDQMRATQLVDPQENYRHYIPSKVTALFSAVDSILGNMSGEYPDESSKLNALHAKFHYMLHKESVQMLLHWLRNDGVRNSTIDRLGEMMRTLMARPLSYGEWIQFQAIKDGFNDFVVDYLEPTNQLARVEIYELEN